MHDLDDHEAGVEVEVYARRLLVTERVKDRPFL